MIGHRLAGLVTGVGLLLTVAVPAHAAVTVAPIFGNSMVLQRDQPVPVWGRASPGESVTVEFAGQKVSTKADAAGKWKVALAALPANATPQELTVTGSGAPTVFKDVLVGEVWLCSGQSNMAWELRKVREAAAEVAAANYPMIRGTVVFAASAKDQGYLIEPTTQTQRYALTPQEKCVSQWSACTPDAAANWSGVAYFFARDLHRELKVPIGLIMSSYGASAIEAWTSVEGLKAIPTYRERAEAYDELVKAFLADTNSFPQALAAQQARLPERNRAWFAQLDAEDPGLKNQWMAPAFDTTQWQPITLPVTPADNPIGAPVASVWFRKEIAVPADWTGKELELKLGIIDGADETYVNGTRVGRTWFDVASYWSVSRVYPVPTAAVTSTNVTVAVRVLKLAYPMAFFGPATNMTLTLSEASVSLTGVWRMAKAQDLDPGRQPRPAPLLDKPPGYYYGHPGAQYNGQIAPVIPYGIRGAIWYQGEANAPFYVDYRTLLPGLITSWRKEWGQGDFHFGIVQLADYQAQQTKAVERISGYHLIRESQMLALQLTNTFIASAVGVGEGADIHPRNKQEVGRRLALPALATVYGKKDRLYYGPLYKKMTTAGDKIRLHFDFAQGLHSAGDPPVGFAIAGADRKFYFANAKIEGETVVVWSAKVPQPVAVRYGYASNPVCNVYNAEKLPVFQFNTDRWDNTQLVNPEDDALILPTGWVPK
ncbi:MAG: hypothetical protein PCFJNLEI_00490 [Verrucomicrobiae bacterium]|nr:hypothetical protein [Verrucomicrobiae bacterium]